MKRDSYIYQMMLHAHDNDRFNMLSQLPVPYNIERTEHLSVCSIFWFLVLYFLIDLPTVFVVSVIFGFAFIVLPILSVLWTITGYANPHDEQYLCGIMVFGVYVFFYLGYLHHKHTKNRKDKHYKIEKSDEPGLLHLMFKSVKEKMCVFVKIED